MTSPAIDQASDRIVEMFDAVGARCCLHVREIGTRRAVAIDDDRLVALASVVKIFFAVAFARAVDTGELDPVEQTSIRAELRDAGAGTAAFSDPVSLSLRDAALLMMSVSDNAATDVVLDRVGMPAAARVVDDLGLRNTQLRHGMHGAHRAVLAELGRPDAGDLDAVLHEAGERVRDLAWIDPTRGANCSTAAEVAALLEAIWTDTAATPRACATVRELMSHQVSRQRIESGFDDDTLQIAVKSGTIPLVRNEAGVISYPDGSRYAAAVFTTARSIDDRQPGIEAAIGRAARLAVDALRS